MTRNLSSRALHSFGVPWAAETFGRTLRVRFADIRALWLGELSQSRSTLRSASMSASYCHQPLRLALRHHRSPLTARPPLFRQPKISYDHVKGLRDQLLAP